MVPVGGDDQVVLLAGRGEVFARVVDNVIGTDGSRNILIASTADGGDFGTRRLGDLHGKRADPAPGALDGDPLTLAGADRACEPPGVR